LTTAEEEKPFERCISKQLSESELSALSIRDKEAVVCISLARIFFKEEEKRIL